MAADTRRLVLRAVNVNWNANDDGWNVNANSVTGFVSSHIL
ncbi:MAG: hypothetical protein AAB655_01165 [Patescibacteria group bacterium]